MYDEAAEAAGYNIARLGVLRHCFYDNFVIFCRSGLQDARMTCIFNRQKRKQIRGDGPVAKKTETDGKRKKRLWIILLPVLGVFAALFVAAFWIAALLFGGEPQLPVEPLRPEDFKLISKLTARFSNEFLNGKPEESELVLTPGEIASLIRVSDNGALLRMFGGGSGGKTKNYDARFENGRFEILSPVRTGLTWLRGGVIMVDMSVRPEKDGDELTLDISRIKAGSIALPGFLVDRMRRQSLEEARNLEEYRLFDRCVKSLRIDEENNLRIVYRPAELLKLMPPKVQQFQQMMRRGR